MSIEVDRKLEYADRTAIQQADQTIKRDVVRALIELITNADDSYRRMEQKKVEIQDLPAIRIFVRRGLIRVSDSAEGFTPDAMDKCVGKYSEETSGSAEGLAVRGYFGRGLKEAILGLGSGSVSSICIGKFTKAFVSVVSGSPTYKRHRAIPATKALRHQLNITSQSGSVIEVNVERAVRFPQIQSLRTRIERHYALREILSNPNRRMNLVELDQRNRPKKEFVLQYQFPTGESIQRVTVPIEGFPNASVEIDVLRSSQPLAGPGTDKESADGGFIIRSPRAVFEISLFKYEHDPAAERLFGKVTCAHLDTLLLAGEPIVRADRTGVDWSHEFAKALKRTVESILAPLVDAERERMKRGHQAQVSREVREKLSSAISDLNSIAQDELGKVATDGEEAPFIPEGGFGFVPPYAHIVAGKQALLLIRAAKNLKFSSGMIVGVNADNPMVIVHSDQVVLEEDAKHESILTARVVLEGRQVGAESVITATLDDAKDEALVQVISKKEPPGDPTPRKGSSLFKDIIFDENADPRFRTRFDNGNIVVSVSSPSVSWYLGAGGKGVETPQGQVMLAELVAEAVCKEVARLGIQKGRFMYIPGAETEAIQREFARLQNLYAGRIHEQFVEAPYRGTEQTGRTGRPPKEVTLSKATVAV